MVRPDARRKFARWCAIFALSTVLVPTNAAADGGIAPTARGGLFFEFGDEAGFSGGFVLWAGASIYPVLPADREGATLVVSPGVELRTGAIPILTGPHQISPQVRFGIASLF